MVSGSLDKTIKIWDVESKNLVYTIQDEHTIYSLTKINGTLLASGSDELIKIWNLNDGSLMKTVSGHQFAVAFLKMFKNGDRLASASFDNSVKIWNVNDKFTLNITINESSALSAFEIISDNLIATGSYSNQLNIWDVNTGKIVQQFYTGFTIETLNMLRDGYRLSIGDVVTGVHLYSIKNSKIIQTIQPGCWRLTQINDTSLAYVSIPQTKYALNVYNLKSNELKQINQSNSYNDLILIDESESLIGLVNQNKIEIWCLKNQTLITTLRGHNNLIISLGLVDNFPKL